MEYIDNIIAARDNSPTGVSDEFDFQLKLLESDEKYPVPSDIPIVLFTSIKETTIEEKFTEFNKTAFKVHLSLNNQLENEYGNLKHIVTDKSSHFIYLDEPELIKSEILGLIINQYRQTRDNSLLDNFRFIHNGKTGYYDTADLNYNNRKELILELYKNYGEQDRLLIKWLLDEEIESTREVDSPVYSVKLCAFMLYKYMQPDDVYQLYNAKFGAGSDLQSTVDMELVFGTDKEETKKYLANMANQLSEEILEAIAYYESNPNAKFKTRPEYIHYFETKEINNILSDLSD